MLEQIAEKMDSLCLKFHTSVAVFVTRLIEYLRGAL
jgi:hypothetical protein